MSDTYHFQVWVSADSIEEVTAPLRAIPGFIEYEFLDVSEEE